MTVTDRALNVPAALAAKAPCVAATTGNIVLSGLQTIDGVALAERQRVLVWLQTDPKQNGIYTASTGNWKRPIDSAGNSSFIRGTSVYVAAGTVNGGTEFIVTCADNPIVVGTSLLTWIAAKLTLANSQAAALLGQTEAARDAAQGYAAAAAAAASSSVAAGSVAKGISGLVPSNSVSSPNTTLDIAVGTARDRTNTVDITLGAGMSKTTGEWGAGNGNGALDSGVVANGASYHAWIIRNPTTLAVDFLYSTAPVNPVMPAGFTQKRRIFAFRTNASGQILPGRWGADGSFIYKDPQPADTNRPLNLVSLLTLPVPIGVKVRARVWYRAFGTDVPNTAFYAMLNDPELGVPLQTGDAVGRASKFYKPNGTDFTMSVEEFTSDTGQVYTGSYPATVNCACTIQVQGWTDLRDEFV